MGRIHPHRSRVPVVPAIGQARARHKRQMRPSASAPKHEDQPIGESSNVGWRRFRRRSCPSISREGLAGVAVAAWRWKSPAPPWPAWVVRGRDRWDGAIGGAIRLPDNRHRVADAADALVADAVDDDRRKAVAPGNRPTLVVVGDVLSWIEPARVVPEVVVAGPHARFGIGPDRSDGLPVHLANDFCFRWSVLMMCLVHSSKITTSTAATGDNQEAIDRPLDGSVRLCPIGCYLVESAALAG